MGIDVYTHNSDGEYPKFVLACNTTDEPFGVLFHGTEKDAYAFIQWLPEDARHYDNDEIDDLYRVFKKHFTKGGKK